MSGIARSPAVLLDTCAMIWLAEGAPMEDEALASITPCGGDRGVFV